MVVQVRVDLSTHMSKRTAISGSMHGSCVGFWVVRMLRVPEWPARDRQRSCCREEKHTLAQLTKYTAQPWEAQTKRWNKAQSQACSAGGESHSHAALTETGQNVLYNCLGKQHTFSTAAATPGSCRKPANRILPPREVQGTRSSVIGKALK